MGLATLGDQTHWMSLEQVSLQVAVSLLMWMLELNLGPLSTAKPFGQPQLLPFNLSLLMASYTIIFCVQG